MNRFALLLPLLIVPILASGKADAATLLALLDTGEMAASEDGGSSWSFRAAIPVPDAAALVAGATPEELHLVSRSGLLYRSGNGGDTWTAVATLPTNDVVDLLPAGGGILVISASGVIHRSSGGNAPFIAWGTMTGQDLVSMARRQDGRLAAITRSGVVFRSDDDGQSWELNGFFPVSDAVAIRADGPDFVAITGTGLAWRSTDGGRTWNAVGSTSQVTTAGMTVSGSSLVAVTEEGLVATSADGSQWSWVGTVNQVRVVAVANDAPQVVGVPGPGSGPVAVLQLSSPFPNPPPAVGLPVYVDVTLGSRESVRLDIVDVMGRIVRTWPETPQGPGTVRLTARPAGLPAGSYRLRVSTARGAAASRPIVIPG
ncbi:MAG TPA: YCF48-related protein [Candidatus Eisenbacteria bacterium]